MEISKKYSGEPKMKSIFKILLFIFKLLLRRSSKVIWEGPYGTGKWRITWWVFYIIPVCSYITVNPYWD